MHVSIDYGKCCGYGICAEVCPEVFAIGDNGLGVVKLEATEGADDAKVRDAADACPELAIAVAT